MSNSHACWNHAATYRYNRRPHKDAKDASVVIVPAARKPTLLSDTATTSPSNHILAELERRTTHSGALGGAQRTDRALTLRSILPASLATLFIVWCAAAYVYHAPIPSTSTRQLNQPLAKRAEMQIAASTEPPTNSATIINASVAELAADAKMATPGLSTSIDEGTISAIPVAPFIPAKAQMRISTVTTTVTQPTILWQAPTPINNKAAGNTAKAVTDTASSSSSADSDVDLLAALIARARQRDPVVTPTTPVSSSMVPSSSSHTVVSPCPMKSSDIRCLR